MAKIKIKALDNRIEELDKWIVTAAAAILDYFNEEDGVFWRESFGVQKDKAKHPTSTNRCYFALFEYLRYLQEENSYEKHSGKRIIEVLRTVAVEYFGLMTKAEGENGLSRDGLSIVRSSSTNKENMFTDGLLLASVALLDGLSEVLQWRSKIEDVGSTALGVDTTAIRETCKPFVEDRLKQLIEAKGGKIHEDDDVHDFVTLYMVRGLDIYYGPESDSLKEVENALSARLREDVLRLLAYKSADINAHFDPAVLAFSISLLNRFPTPDVHSLTRRAIEAIVTSQTADGVWPAAQLISSAGHGLLHVSSYEIGLTLTQLLLRRIQEGELTFFNTVVSTLDRVVGLVKSNYEIVNMANTGRLVRGWSNDHNQRTNLTESWTTAIVLTFLIQYRDALLQLRQEMILALYETKLPEAAEPAGNCGWPDLGPALRCSNDVDMERIERISDPTDDAALTEAIKGQILAPIAANPIHKPKIASLILYGPPATRKTTLVTQLAQALHWPLLVLSPPTFLNKGGLDGFEARAATIFNHLMRLRRVVVLFDECEDFFRDRKQAQSNLEGHTENSREGREGRLITSGMLPRLQNLRDEQWLIFVLATNSRLSELDRAVTRPGRFDYAEKMDYPTLDAQLRYLRSHKLTNGLEANLLGLLANSLEAYEQRRLKREKEADRQSANRDEDHEDHVSFAHIDKLIARVREMQEPTEAAIIDVLSEQVEQKGPPSLT